MENQVVLITGGGSGFGRAMALRFASRGCRVLISGRRAEALARTAADAAERGGPQVQWIQADMTRPQDARAMADKALELWGRIDVMINNAGGGIRIAPFAEYADEEIRRIIEANLMTVIAGCRAVVPAMKEQQSGTIINLSSVCAKHAWPSWSVYTAAKAGVLGLGRCLHGELRPFGIRVGTLIPGAAETEFASSARMPFQLTGESLRPEDVAEAACLMAAMPDRAFVEELKIWGMNQEVIPL